MKNVYFSPEAELRNFRAKEVLAVKWEYEKVTDFDAYRWDDSHPSEVDVDLPTYPDGEY